MRRLRALLGAVTLLFSASIATAQDGTKIITVNHALQYFAQRLADEGTQVIFPVPDGVDPSFWRPSIADISTIQSADLIVLNGAGFATWVDRVSLPRSKVVNTTAAIEDRFIVTESITHNHGEGDTHSHEGLASYTWLDPTLAIAQAQAIAAAITRRNLAAAEDVQARLATLTADLEALDADSRKRLAGLADIAIIATHPRYQYLARQYGLNITALEWEAGAMPTAQELEDLEARTQETGARILLWEAPPPTAAIDAAAALSLESVTFSPLAHDIGEGDYITAMTKAVTALSDAATRAKDE